MALGNRQPAECLEKAWVGRLSQTGRDGQETADMGLHRWVLGGLTLCFQKQSNAQGGELRNYSHPQKNSSLEDRMLASNRKGKERKKKIESLFFLLFLFTFSFFKKIAYLFGCNRS